MPYLRSSLQVGVWLHCRVGARRRFVGSSVNKKSLSSCGPPCTVYSWITPPLYNSTATKSTVIFLHALSSYAPPRHSLYAMMATSDNILLKSCLPTRPLLFWKREKSTGTRPGSFQALHSYKQDGNNLVQAVTVLVLVHIERKKAYKLWQGGMRGQCMEEKNSALNYCTPAKMVKDVIQKTLHRGPQEEAWDFFSLNNQLTWVWLPLYNVSTCTLGENISNMV